MKTSKDTLGTKLESGNENYGYHSDEPRTMHEWLGLDTGKIWMGECQRRTWPTEHQIGICLAVGGHYLGYNF